MKAYRVILHHRCGARTPIGIHSPPHEKYLHIYPKDVPGEKCYEGEEEVWTRSGDLSGMPIYSAPDNSETCHGSGRPCQAHRAGTYDR